MKVRLCGNYKMSIIPHIADEHYQFAPMNDQLVKLKGEYYTCLDITGAFGQVPVDEKTGTILALNTSIGFRQPSRMPQGVKTTPKIFQAAMDNLIHGMDGAKDLFHQQCV